MGSEPENRELKALISNRIHKYGRLTFADYMDLTLYHPIEGYYNSPREKIGKDGDYYTSPHVHWVFGHLMAGLIYQMWNIMEKKPNFTIVEAGAGKGFLCCDILDCIRDRFPDLYKSLAYIIIEVSDYFSSSQRELLKRNSHEDKAVWYHPDDLKKGEFSFDGCYLSNELIDSFPFNRVKMEGGKLKEIYVTVNETDFTEELGELSTPALERYFSDLNIELEEGQTAEVNLRIYDWLDGVNNAMGRGFVITIDYGYTADELFAPYRKDGTISCYYKHTINHNPYMRVGFQDITAHVDFTTLIESGERIGLKKTVYMEQYRFLIALGLLDIVGDFEKNIYNMSTVEYYRNKLAMKNFLLPGGMGVLFKVLVQHKGVEGFQIFKEGQPNE